MYLTNFDKCLYYKYWGIDVKSLKWCGQNVEIIQLP